MTKAMHLLLELLCPDKDSRRSEEDKSMQESLDARYQDRDV